MVTIENAHISVRIKTKGAELDSLFSKETNMEYLWSGDAAFWNKKSPILFPIVGTLKHNTYYYNNKAYELSRHGFARDMDFEVSDQFDTRVTFTLKHNEATLQVFPFPFVLNVTYSVGGNELFVHYGVLNMSEQNMYFSIGAHPAFKVPMDEKNHYEDYLFEFDQTEDAYRWIISREGLIEPTTLPFLINTNELPITRELFRNDALVFKYMNSAKVKLRSRKSEHGVEVHYDGFPFLGLWAAPNANFVCIEPWCGIADSTTTNQQLINKEGINLLTPQHNFDRTWSVRLF